MNLSKLFPRFVFCLILAISAPELYAQVGNNNPTGPSGAFNGSVTTGCHYDPFTANAKRTLTEMVVAGAVGEYGLSISRTWNSRTPGWTWSHTWRIDAAGAPGQHDSYLITFPDGRQETFNYTTADVDYRAAPGVRDRMQPWTATNGNFGVCYLVLPDGGKIEFSGTRIAQHDPELIPPDWYDFDLTATAMIDPYGLRTTYTYPADGSFTITEPAGRWIKVFYNAPLQVVDYISASDGREVHYTWQTQYFGVPSVPSVMLTSASYYNTSSLTATYTYATAAGRHGYVLATANDPMYPGPMKNIAYDYKANPNPDGSAQVAGQIQNEKSGLTGDFVTTLTVTGTNTRTETRADGRLRTFTYNANGYLFGWTDFKNVASSQSYDSKMYVASVTDGNGHTTNYTNNPLTGAVTQIQYPATPNDTTPSSNNRGTVTYTYGWASCPDPNNQDVNNPYYLYKITDEAGHDTIFTRDTNKRVTRIDYADGGYETFVYNSLGQVLTHLLKTGGIESFTYSGGLRQDYRSPDNASGNPTARYGYDSLGRLSAVTDVFGLYPGDPYHTTTYQYNTRGQLTVTTLPTDPVDGLHHNITNTYNPNGDGTLVSMTDQLGHTTSYTYDDYRRLRSMTTPLRSPGDSTLRTTYFSYDRTQGTADDYTHTDSNMTRLTLPSGNIIQTTYDENYRKKDIIASSGSGTDLAKTSYGYDDAGNLTSIVLPDQQPGGAHQNLSTTWAYDERNRLMSVTDPLNPPTSYTYDLGGRKKTVTQPNTQVITYDAYDSMNRLLQQTVQQTNQLSAVTQYTYEPATGLHMTMKDPHLVQNGSSEVYTFEYDVMGRAKNLTYPAPTPGGTPRTEEHTYDTAGRPHTYTNRDGKMQTFSYDNLHRQTGFTWTAGSAPNVSFAHDVANRVTSITNSDAAISRTYFDDNLLKAETQTPTGGSANTVTYAWNADANGESILYPSGKKYRYNYSGRDQLKQVQDNVAPFNYQAEYVYDVNGNVATRKVGVNVGFSSVTTDASQRDALGRCTHLLHQFPAVSGGSRTFDYVFDAMSNRTSIQRDAGTADLYDYDLAEQVKTGVDGGNPHTYGYDANGNRTTMDGTGIYATNNLNQETTFNGFTVSYDNNGNVGSSGAGSLSNCLYDAQNRLTSVTFGTTQTTFKYDGLNRKISQTVGGVGGVTTYNVWDGWNLIEERGTGNTLLNSYVYGAGEIIERINVAGTYFYYQDGLGSTSHLADTTGALQESYKYNTFGQTIVYAPDGSVRKGGSNYDVRHLFTGQLWMPQSGLYDYRNRLFSPSLTRFLQPDPIGFAGDPSNLYRYCGNDPVNYTDPLGLWQFTMFAGAGLAGYVSFGYNSGTFNIGGGPGYGYGIGGSFNAGNQAPRAEGGVIDVLGTAGLGNGYVGGRVTGSVGEDGVSVTATGRVGRLSDGVKYNVGKGTVTHTGPSFTAGGGFFIGLVGTAYFRNEPMPPPGGTTYVDPNSDIPTTERIIVTSNYLPSTPSLGSYHFDPGTFFSPGFGSGLNSGSHGGASAAAVFGTIFQTLAGVPGGGGEPGEGFHPPGKLF
jgi:RHS repeat-associated protein